MSLVSECRGEGLLTPIIYQPGNEQSSGYLIDRRRVAGVAHVAVILYRNSDGRDYALFDTADMALPPDYHPNPMRSDVVRAALQDILPDVRYPNGDPVFPTIAD